MDRDGGEPIINIWGEKVALGPVRRDMMPLYERWMNDWEVTRGVGRVGPFTTEAEIGWYEQVSNHSSETVHFNIYELGPEGSPTYLRPIGTVGLHDINFRNSKGVFGIMIGEKDAWGKGYGTEVAALMLDYGFNVLGLHNISLRVFGFNKYAIRAYERAGFQIVGKVRESHFLFGTRHDDIIMDCLSTEFEGKAIKRFMP